MANKPLKIMGGGCLGTLIGAFLGVVIGGFIVSVSQESTHEVRAQNLPEIGFEIGGYLFGGALAMLMGTGIGGIIGGIGGSILGAGLAAKASRRQTEELPSDAELARLKERVTELEAKMRSDGRFKEEGAGGLS
jgi:hypothetical protein